MAFKLAISVMVMLVVIQMGSSGASPAKGGKAEAIITKKLNAATPGQLNKYKMAAAKRMVTDMEKSMQALSTSKDVPADVQTSAKNALKGLQAGKLTAAIAKSIPTILMKASAQLGKPAEQLQTILGSMMPNSPLDMKNSLQGTLNFLNENLEGVSNLLGQVSGGVPDLLSGTVKSLSGTLGVAADSINGSVGSLGALMGGMMN